MRRRSSGATAGNLPLTDNTVSRRHCELLPADDGGWILRDVGSANGTYVNGTRVNGRYGAEGRRPGARRAGR